MCNVLNTFQYAFILGLQTKQIYDCKKIIPLFQKTILSLTDNSISLNTVWNIISFPILSASCIYSHVSNRTNPNSIKKVYNKYYIDFALKNFYIIHKINFYTYLKSWKKWQSFPEHIYSCC